jgi:glycosyltransferase involved in cell wall biosynthesis
MEGGANVISEALAASVPILASRIPSTIGLLGKDYPGYFEVTDTVALKELLIRTETDADFYAQLANACTKRTPLIHPTHERHAWQRLIEELRS